MYSNTIRLYFAVLGKKYNSSFEVLQKQYNNRGYAKIEFGTRFEER